MFKGLFRLLGLLILAIAVITAVLDIARSIADSALVVTSLGEDWVNVSAVSLNQAQFAIQEFLHPWIWDPVIQSILILPSWIVFTVIALLFLWIGRKKKSSWQATYGA